MADTHSEITQKVMDAFFRIRRLHRQSPVSGLKHSEVRVLFMIRKNLNHVGMGSRICELSQIMRVTSPAVTQLINSLEESGLVERTSDPKDRRYIRVTLTPKGETVLKQASDAYFRSFSRMVNHLGEEKSRQLAELLSESVDFMRRDAVTNFGGEQE